MQSSKINIFFYQIYFNHSILLLSPISIVQLINSYWIPKFSIVKLIYPKLIVYELQVTYPINNKFIQSIQDYMVKMFKIIFKAKVETAFTQNVKIVGSIKQLGNWNPIAALQMHTNQNIFPIWEAANPIEIEEKTHFQFKLIICCENNIIKWQSNENRKISICENELVICKWNNPLMQLQELKVVQKMDSEQRFLQKAKSMTTSPRKTIHKNSSIQIQNRNNTFNFVLIYNEYQQATPLKQEKNQEFQIFHFNIINFTQSKKHLDLEYFEVISHISKEFIQENRFICIKRKEEIVSYFKNLSIVPEYYQDAIQKQFKEFIKCRFINFLTFKKLQRYIQFLEQRRYPVKKYKQSWISVNQNGYQIIVIGNFRKTSKQLVQLYYLKNDDDLQKEEVQKKREIKKQMEKYFNFWDKAILEFESSLQIKKGLQKINKHKTMMIIKFEIIHRDNYFKNSLNQIMNEVDIIYWIIQTNIQWVKNILTPNNYNKINIITKKGTSIKLKNQDFKKAYQKEPFSLNNLKTKIQKYNCHNSFLLKEHSDYYIELIPQLIRIYQSKRQLIKNEINRQKNITYEEMNNKMYIYSHDQMKVLDKILEANYEVIIIGQYKEIAEDLIYRKKNTKINCFKSIYQFKSSLS